MMGSIHTKFAYKLPVRSFVVAGFAALGIVYVFFGPSSTRQRHGRHLAVKGLANMGQTCYFSAVIQSLASCAHFRHWLQLCSDPAQRPMSHLYPLVSALHRACLLVNRQDKRENPAFNPQVSILRILSSMNYRLVHGREQDAFELFQFIMSALQEETVRMIEKSNGNDFSCIVPNETPISNVIERKVDDATRTVDRDISSIVDGGAGDTDTETNENIPVMITNLNKGLDVSNHIAHRLGYYHSVKKGLQLNPFLGALASRLTCLTCTTKHKWIVEKNQGFSLHLPAQKSDKLTLRDLFSNYLKTVIVHDVECRGCSAKNGTPTKSSFSKVTVVIRLPRSLCLQIQRSSWNAFGGHVRSDYVTFQELLDLSTIQRFKDTLRKSAKSNDIQKHIQQTLNVMSGLNLSSYNTGSLYRLCAVISHSSSQSGGPESGHFVTFRRGPVNSNLWFLTSDEDVYEVPLVSVLSSNAYMLFYELTDSDIPATTS